MNRKSYQARARRTGGIRLKRVDPIVFHITGQLEQLLDKSITSFKDITVALTDTPEEAAALRTEFDRRLQADSPRAGTKGELVGQMMGQA